MKIASAVLYLACWVSLSSGVIERNEYELINEFIDNYIDEAFPGRRQLGLPSIPFLGGLFGGDTMTSMQAPHSPGRPQRGEFYRPARPNPHPNRPRPREVITSYKQYEINTPGAQMYQIQNPSTPSYYTQTSPQVDNSLKIEPVFVDDDFVVYKKQPGLDYTLEVVSPQHTQQQTTVVEYEYTVPRRRPRRTVPPARLPSVIENQHQSNWDFQFGFV